MTQPYDLDEPFAVYDLGDRDRHLANNCSQPRDPYPHGWDDLHYIANTDRRDALRIYARLGLHPIALHGLNGDKSCTCGRADCPPRTRGKHPVISAWQRAQLDLDAADRMLISNWRFNVGLRCGAQPNGRFLVVVDVDGPRDLLAPLEEEHGAFPATLTARTGSGGLHFYYWVREGVEIGNRVGIVPHVDIRGRGGQVVAPPSLHHSGKRYEWIDVREPEILP
jgi:hypothetical protein